MVLSFGNIIGRTAHFEAEATLHFTNLFAVIVGVTSHGRKGSSWGQIVRLFRSVDPEWAATRKQVGLASGEGLIWAVHDPVIDSQKTRSGDSEGVVVEPAVDDKRLVVFESEFASTLRVMSRHGNTVSAVVREAWDTGNLQTMTRNSPARATGAHISIVGHITRDELRRELSATEMGNGFANRFLWVCAKRSKELPEGGNLADSELVPFVERLRHAVEFAKTVGKMRRADGIREMWARTYHLLTADKPGLLGSVTSRAEAQVMRLSCVYALLDESPVVRAEHLLAALALWEYCHASAQFIFGNAVGDPMADTILQALRYAPAGLDRTDVSGLFQRHKNAGQIANALTVLQERNLATMRRERKDADGRVREVWFALDMAAK